jgi:hypothetical protein
MTTETDPREELDVPHLEERLRAELAELYAEMRRSSPATRNTGDELRRRRALRLARIGVAAATVLVVGVFAALWVGTRTDRSDGPGSAARPDRILFERIATATDDALTESLVHSVEDWASPDGERRTLEMWHDETTGVVRMLLRDDRGNPVNDDGPLAGPTPASPAHSGRRVVDYCSQRYVEAPDISDANSDLSPGAVDARDLLAGGELVEDGTEEVGGRQLIRLRGGTDPERGGYVLLVDPDTYRVVGQRSTSHTGEAYATVFEYLPRTEQSLDLLHPPIPDGFTQVDANELSVLPVEPC